MPWDEDNESYRESVQGTSSRYTAPSESRYTAVARRSRRRRQSTPVAASVPVLEAQTARFETYPNEIAVFYLGTALSIDNDTETVVVFDTTDSRWAMEQGLARDLTNLDRIDIRDTPSGMVFEVEGFVSFAADADGYRQVAIDSEDGLAYQVLACVPSAGAAVPTVVPFQGTLVRQETDTYLQIKVKHTAGAALTVTAAQFHIMRIH